MSVIVVEGFEKSRLKSLLDHFGNIDDPRGHRHQPNDRLGNPQCRRRLSACRQG